MKCGADLPEGAAYCPYCGKAQNPTRKQTKRGNGTGSVYQLPNKKWRAEITLGYEIDKQAGKLKRIRRSKDGFRTKKEALEYLPQLRQKPVVVDKGITFKGLYERWLPGREEKVQAGELSNDTLNCYRAAFKHFEPIWYAKVSELKTAALQECLNTCGKGRRTQENMKALGTQLYRFAAKDDLVDRNYAELLEVGGTKQSPREPFTEDELAVMWDMYKEIPYLDQVLILCYTGFRIDELLSLTGADLHKEVTDGQTWWYFIGGEKTSAGKERMVAISPKILPLVLPYRKPGYLFSEDGQKVTPERFRKRCYYPALDAAGLPRRVPHCCRHTYATLMKNVEVSDADKIASIGHTSKYMTQKYTHADKRSQKKLADAL